MKNMKVSMKLILSFLIVVALAVLVGGIGIFGMSSINSADDALYNENVVAINAMGDIREAIQRQRVGIRNYALDGGNESKLQEWRATMKTTEDTILENFAIYEGTITDESVESAYYEAKSLYLNEWAAIKDEVYQASLIGRDEGYERLFDPNVVATSNRLTDAFSVSMDNNSQWAEDTVNNNTALFQSMLIAELLVLAAAAAIAMILAVYISGMISKPLGVLTAFMNKAGSTGDITLTQQDILNIDMYAKNKDETGQCIGSTASFIKHITTISNELESVSNGDISISVNLLSDKDTMGLSMKKMVDNLNNMFGEINASTAQVSTGSKQVADGAQALAQGSTEQAAAVQQLSSSISEIAEKTRANAEMADKAARLAETIRGNAEKGSSQMDEMMTAVKEINQASQSINKVIKVIDDIAFQTNILALNAAVEAARAGQHGKGFAVVAEEVRNLAAKSAEAAKDTGGLIANSMEKAELGARIADETAASLVEIVSGINESSQIVSEIARSSEEQAEGISQVNKGIDQVAQVVQQNSATAEQSAAASEEMSGQSSMLESLIAQFKLREGGNSGRRSLSGAGRAKALPERPSNAQSGGGDFGKY